MSSTLSNLPYARFIRQARSERYALVSTQAALDQSLARLRAAPWVKARPGLSVTMPPSNPAQTESSDAYDAYKFSGDCPPASGGQASFAGMAAYRFTIPASAIAAGANLESVGIMAYASKFLSHGLRVAAFMSAEAYPDAFGWDVLRGDAPGAARLEGFLADPAAGTSAARNKDAVAEISLGQPCQQYLWVVVQIEDWPEIKWEYWVEGAGFLNAGAMSATFDANGITHDAPGGTFEFPAGPEDFEEPSRVQTVYQERAAVRVWGDGAAALLPAPDVPDAVDVFFVDGFAVALLADGTLRAWGPAAVSSGAAAWAAGVSGAVAISGVVLSPTVGALLADGTVTVHGFSGGAFLGAVAGVSGAKRLAVGPNGIIVIGEDGVATVIESDGLNDGWFAHAPIPDAAAAACAVGAACVVKTDGTAVGWAQYDSYGEASGAAAQSGLADASGGNRAFAGLRTDGTLCRWGYNNTGDTSHEDARDVRLVRFGMFSGIYIRNDGTVGMFGSDPYGIGAGLGAAAMPRAVCIGGVNVSDSSALAIVTERAAPQAWTAHEASAPAEAALTLWDPHATRDRLVRAAASAANALASWPAASGAYGAETAGGVTRLTASAACLAFDRRHTDAPPNRLHYSLPAIAAHDGRVRYIRVIVLLDSGDPPRDPVATLSGWKDVWAGKVPQGYQLVGSEYLEHGGFVNSRFLPVSPLPVSGHLWFIVMPMHIELPGASEAFNVEGGGWDAAHIFLYRDE
ncbi:MAG: hypothetical protein FWH21_00080 [Kiritimatiellaeota bacterium]|nr:hypothetical protein [Kiritimatiellota bacterium]